jgi:hypothetical protein
MKLYRVTEEKGISFYVVSNSFDNAAHCVKQILEKSGQIFQAEIANIEVVTSEIYDFPEGEPFIQPEKYGLILDFKNRYNFKL